MLVVAGRYSVLLGLAVWIGIAVGLLVMLPAFFRQLQRPQAHELAGLVLGRADRVLMGAWGLTLLALISLSATLRTIPAAYLLVSLAAMTGLRLLGSFSVGPATRALRGRMHDANPPASDTERRAFERLYKTSLVLIGLEAALGLYALFILS